MITQNVDTKAWHDVTDEQEFNDSMVEGRVYWCRRQTPDGLSYYVCMKLAGNMWVSDARMEQTPIGEYGMVLFFLESSRTLINQVEHHWRKFS